MRALTEATFDDRQILSWEAKIVAFEETNRKSINLIVSLEMQRRSYNKDHNNLSSTHQTQCIRCACTNTVITNKINKQNHNIGSHETLMFYPTLVLYYRKLRVYLQQ